MHTIAQKVHTGCFSIFFGHFDRPRPRSHLFSLSAHISPFLLQNSSKLTNFHPHHPQNLTDFPLYSPLNPQINPKNSQNPPLFAHFVNIYNENYQFLYKTRTKPINTPKSPSFPRPSELPHHKITTPLTSRAAKSCPFWARPLYTYILDYILFRRNSHGCASRRV